MCVFIAINNMKRYSINVKGVHWTLIIVIHLTWLLRVANQPLRRSCILFPVKHIPMAASSKGNYPSSHLWGLEEVLQSRKVGTLCRLWTLSSSTVAYIFPSHDAVMHYNLQYIICYLRININAFVGDYLNIVNFEAMNPEQTRKYIRSCWM